MAENVREVRKIHLDRTGLVVRFTSKVMKDEAGDYNVGGTVVPKEFVALLDRERNHVHFHPAIRLHQWTILEENTGKECVRLENAGGRTCLIPLSRIDGAEEITRIVF